jgi:DHA1 family bicyclomycin/chloramphenicol resistance-like MFS transporter
MNSIEKILPFLLILFLVPCCIEIDISVPSFPEMVRYFATTEAVIQLTVAYNFLGFFLAAFFYGPLSDAYGRRKVMIIGNTLLTIGAMGCVYAPSIPFLLVSRFIQGLGAATPAVLVSAMVADVYQGQKATKFIGLMNAILTTLMAIAPVIGSFITKAVGWRGNYAIVAFVCLISWIMSLISLPETKKEFDVFDTRKMVKDYRKLFGSLLFLSASFVPSALYAAYLAFIACAPFLYMETFGMSITEYALHQAVIVGSFSAVSFFVNRISQKFGNKRCVIYSCVSYLLSTAALAFVGFFMPHSPYWITFLVTVGGIAEAVYYPIIFGRSLEIFPEIKGTSSSVIMSMRALIIAATVAIAGYLYNGEVLNLALVMFTMTALCLGLTLYFLKAGLLKEAQ